MIFIVEILAKWFSKEKSNSNITAETSQKVLSDFKNSFFPKILKFKAKFLSLSWIARRTLSGKFGRSSMRYLKWNDLRCINKFI